MAGLFPSVGQEAVSTLRERTLRGSLPHEPMLRELCRRQLAFRGLALPELVPCGLALLPGPVHLHGPESLASDPEVVGGCLAWLGVGPESLANDPEVVGERLAWLEVGPIEPRQRPRGRWRAPCVAGGRAREPHQRPRGRWRAPFRGSSAAVSCCDFLVGSVASIPLNSAGRGRESRRRLRPDNEAKREASPAAWLNQPMAEPARGLG